MRSVLSFFGSYMMLVRREITLMKAYQKHLQTSRSFGEDLPPDYRPVMRSSAAFPLRYEKDKLDTEVTFMGYWLLKRTLQEVGIVLTVRDEKGEKLHLEHLLVTGPRAYVWRISDLADAGKIAPVFTGSIEVEIFSTRDMVFPYPAITFSFVSSKGRGFVHTCGRIYNDLADLQENNQTVVPEAGFDLIPDAGYDPFFSFVNGPVDQSGARFELELVNQDGEAMRVSRTLESLPPYGTAWVRVFAGEAERQHLGKGMGTVKIRHDFKGFFPRFVAGNEHVATRAVSLTHSYYDTSSELAEGTYWVNSDPEAFDDAVMPVAVPAAFGRVELVIYPIYPKSRTRLYLDFYAADGGFLFRDPDVRYLADGQTLQYIDCRKIADRNGYSGRDLLCRLIVDGEGECPARLKFGINFGNRGKVDMPSNICTGALMANPKLMDKPGTFKWCPVFEPENTRVYLTNTGFPRRDLAPAQVKLSVWRCSDDSSLDLVLDVPWNGMKEAVFENRQAVADFLQGTTGWMTFSSNNPFLNGYYVTDYGHGLIGADHVY